MNKFNFNQGGGFPLSTNILDEIQTSYTPLINGLGAMAGSLAILSGCEESGNSVKDGLVQINGETFEFKGSIKQDTVVIIDESKTAQFEDGSNKTILIKRYATFGSGIQNYLWKDFKRVPTLNNIPDKLNEKTDKNTTEELLQRISKLEKLNAPDSLGGTIKIWCRPQNQIPPGWAPADEFIGKMLRGGYNINTDGGNDIIKLNTNQLPQFSLRYKDFYYIENYPNISGIAGKEYLGSGLFGSGKSDYDNSYGYYKWGTTEPIGNSENINITNKHRIVLFIRWIG